MSIGDGSIIGAGSVVTKDIPAGVIAAGVPCKVIREITDDDILEDIKWYLEVCVKLRNVLIVVSYIEKSVKFY